MRMRFEAGLYMIESFLMIHSKLQLFSFVFIESKSFVTRSENTKPRGTTIL